MDNTLQAVRRESRGKNEARRLRAAGRIPVVVRRRDIGADCRGPQRRCSRFCTRIPA